MKTQVKTANSTVESLQKMLNEKEGAVEQLSTAKSTLQQDLSQYQKQITELTQRFASHSLRILTTTSKHDVMMSMERMKQTHERELFSLNSKLQGLMKYFLELLFYNVLETQMERDSLKTNVASLQQTIFQLQSAKTQLEQQLTKHLASIQELQDSLQRQVFVGVRMLY